MSQPSSRRLWSSRCHTLVSSLWLLAVSAALTACGGGSGTSNLTTSSGTGTGGTGPSCNSGCGTAMIALTDAAGDFDSYIVNVVSLQLTREDGTVVQTVPVTTQVDFSQLVSLSEILSAAQIPAGRYVSASMTLDYGSATIVVDNGTSGVRIAPSHLIDGATGLALVAPNPTQMTLTLSLPSNGPFVVTANEVANLSLDFNLAASNTITPSDTNPATVTVNPVLTASFVPDATKTLEVRGPLVSVNAAGSSYSVGVRPFYNQAGVSGQLTVNTTTSTAFTINGTAYTGSAGLAQLSSLAAGTLTSAQGTWDTDTQTFTASTVLAGTSVIGVGLDRVSGTVIARSGDSLTVAGGFMVPASSAAIGFAPQVTVTVGSGTAVSEQGVAGSFNAQDISVGQHAEFAGAFSVIGGTVSLDATAGSALLETTRVTGTVNSSAGNVVTLTLLTLDGRPASVFNFAGTGTSSATDASASAYTVSVPASLTLPTLASGAAAGFIGFVTPFGAADGSSPPDFAAVSFINYSQTPALLLVRWAPPGVTAPFATLTDSELAISQATLGASAQATLSTGPVLINAATLGGGLQIDPNIAAPNPQFAIVHLKSRNIASFSSFDDFVTALTSELNGSNDALQVVAEGPYDAATAALSVNAMAVLSND
jgi:Domain of unknown function (DUF4382)